MKTKLIISVLVTFISLLCFHNVSAQEEASFDLGFEVNRVLPEISITETELSEAVTVEDLNRFFKPSWVQKYQSVNIISYSDGENLQAKSNNNILTPKQKEIMENVDIDRNISVEIKYLPENSLSQNGIKSYDFSFSVDPDIEARFIGGQEKLDRYFQDYVMTEIDKEKFEQHKLRAVYFTVNPVGDVVDVSLYNGDAYGVKKDTPLENLLIDKICGMPKWKPAEYTNGQKISQKFAFTIGDHNSCIVNVLNIRRLPIEN